MSSYMFEGTILSSITIPSTITTMGQLPFALCLTLTYINLVSGLSIIGREFLYSFDPFNYFSMMITMITVPSTITRFGFHINILILIMINILTLIYYCIINNLCIIIYYYLTICQ